MHLNIPYLRRFLYGHYFFGGIRQAVGMLLPAILGSFFGHFALGIVATLGALCLAIIDQPGGPQVAVVTGTYRGRGVEARFSRTDGCEISRWKSMAPLLGGTAGSTGAV